jgi:tetratricopeptide (TPR) repeat protein
MFTALTSPAIEQNSFQSLFDAATRIFKDGRVAEARQSCRTLTETHPEQPSAWFLYGMTALEGGDATTAIPALERAAAMHRSNAGYKRTLARAYRSVGRQEDAATTLEHALRLEPDHPAAMLSLGQIRIAQDDRDAGMELCRRGLAAGLRGKWRRACVNAAGHVATIIGIGRHVLNPGGNRAASIAFKRGQMYRRLGDSEAALECYRNAAELAPDYLPALAELGQMLVAREQFAAALPYLERTAQRDADDPALRIAHAAALTGMLRFDEAIDILEEVFSHGAETPRALLALGRAQTGAGDAKAARRSFKRALMLAPNSAEAHFALGRNLQENGEIEIANRLFFDTLAIDPEFANAYRFLAANKAVAPGDETFARMLALLESGGTGQTDRIRLHFAAATVFEQAGDIDNAFAHFAAGNDLKPVVFDPDCCADYFGQLIETFNGDFFARTQAWGSQDERPVFIVGMPRSGTTLVEQILASHRDVFGAGELEAFNGFVDGLAARAGTDAAYPGCAERLDRDGVAAMADEHLAALRRLAPDARLVTDKMPTNFLHVGLIATLFPNARIIHCRRDPRDTCFSIYGLDFAGEHSYAYDQKNLGRYYRQYERLMDHWRHAAPAAILDVRYEDLIADQEAETRRMLDFCDLDWDEHCLAFHETERTVRTWSYRQVRQPIYKTSVARWRKFAQHLTPLLDELQIDDGADTKHGPA